MGHIILLTYTPAPSTVSVDLLSVNSHGLTAMTASPPKRSTTSVGLDLDVPNFKRSTTQKSPYHLRLIPHLDASVCVAGMNPTRGLLRILQQHRRIHDPAELYVNGVKDKLALYHAAWLPNVKLDLGDLGVLKNKFFEPVRNLKEIGIGFQERPDNSPSTLDIVSDEGVSVTFKLAGQTNPKVPHVPTADAGVAVEFGSQGAFLIQASEAFQPPFSDVAKLQDEVLNAYAQGKWRLEWAIIVRLLRSSNATILVSRSASAKIEMSASGQVPAGGFKLADANVKLSVLHQSGGLVRVDRAVSVTPLFQLARIHRHFLSAPQVSLEKAQSDIIAELTPELVRSNATVAVSLYLELVR